MIPTPNADRSCFGPPRRGRSWPAGAAFRSTLTALLLLGAMGIVGWLALRTAPTATSASGTPDSSPSNERSRVPVAEAVETILDAARQHIQMNQHEQARVILAEAVRTHPEQQVLRSTYADVLVALALPADAYEQYVAALSIGPRTAPLEFAAGTMAKLTDRSQLALEHYTAAQTADPSNPTYPLYLAQIQRSLNQPAEAKASLVRVVHMQPDNAIAWGTLADIALGENKIDMALQHVAKARAIEPRVGAWRLIEARALKRQSKPDQALMVMAGLTDAEKFQLHNARLIAECHAMKGELPQAVAAVTAAADAGPADADLALEAAVWLQHANDLTRAREYARRAQMLGNDRAAEVLAGLGAE